MSIHDKRADFVTQDTQFHFVTPKKELKNVAGHHIRITPLHTGADGKVSAAQVKVDSALKKWWLNFVSLVSRKEAPKYLTTKEEVTALLNNISKNKENDNPGEAAFIQKTSELALNKLMKTVGKDDSSPELLDIEKRNAVEYFADIYSDSKNPILQSLGKQARATLTRSGDAEVFFDNLQKYHLDKGNVDVKFVAKEMASEVLKNIPEDERKFLSGELRSRIETLLVKENGRPNFSYVQDHEGHTGPILLVGNIGKDLVVMTNELLINEAKTSVFNSFMTKVGKPENKGSLIQEIASKHLQGLTQDQKFDALVSYGIDPLTAKITDQNKFASQVARDLGGENIPGLPEEILKNAKDLTVQLRLASSGMGKEVPNFNSLWQLKNYSPSVHVGLVLQGSKTINDLVESVAASTATPEQWVKAVMQLDKESMIEFMKKLLVFGIQEKGEAREQIQAVHGAIFDKLEEMRKIPSTSVSDQSPLAWSVGISFDHANTLFQKFVDFGKQPTLDLSNDKSLEGAISELTHDHNKDQFDALMKVFNLAVSKETREAFKKQVADTWQQNWKATNEAREKAGKPTTSWDASWRKRFLDRL